MCYSSSAMVTTVAVFIENEMLFVIKVISHRKVDFKKYEKKIIWNEIYMKTYNQKKSVVKFWTWQKVLDYIAISQVLVTGIYTCLFNWTEITANYQYLWENQISKIHLFLRQPDMGCLHSIFLAEAISFYPPSDPAPIWEPEGIFINQLSLR